MEWLLLDSEIPSLIHDLNGLTFIHKNFFKVIFFDREFRLVHKYRDQEASRFIVQLLVGLYLLLCHLLEVIKQL